jgi:hypothetical protein
MGHGVNLERERDWMMRVCESRLGLISFSSLFLAAYGTMLGVWIVFNTLLPGGVDRGIVVLSPPATCSLTLSIPTIHSLDDKWITAMIYEYLE